MKERSVPFCWLILSRTPQFCWPYNFVGEALELLMEILYINANGAAAHASQFEDKLRFGSVVQLVLWDTSIVTPENHPIHIHGYDFYILVEGFGNFDPKKDDEKFNLVDPPQRNTMAVPVNGWAVIQAKIM